jgi:hypothetical protein
MQLIEGQTNSVLILSGKLPSLVVYGSACQLPRWTGLLSGSPNVRVRFAGKNMIRVSPEERLRLLSLLHIEYHDKE